MGFPGQGKGRGKPREVVTPGPPIGLEGLAKKA